MVKIVHPLHSSEYRDFLASCLTFLSQDELLTVRQVCKNWQKLATETYNKTYFQPLIKKAICLNGFNTLVLRKIKRPPLRHFLFRLFEISLLFDILKTANIQSLNFISNSNFPLTSSSGICLIIKKTVELTNLSFIDLKGVELDKYCFSLLSERLKDPTFTKTIHFTRSFIDSTYFNVHDPFFQADIILTESLVFDRFHRKFSSIQSASYENAFLDNKEQMILNENQDSYEALLGDLEHQIRIDRDLTRQKSSPPTLNKSHFLTVLTNKTWNTFNHLLTKN